MKLSRILWSVLLAGSAVFADRLAVLKSDASAYPQEHRRVYEKPMFQLSKGEVVELMKTSMPLSQVRTRSGRVGWVETPKLDTVNHPPMLSLIPADTVKAAAPTAKQDSLIAKQWLKAHKGTVSGAAADVQENGAGK